MLKKYHYKVLISALSLILFACNPGEVEMDDGNTTKIPKISGIAVYPDGSKAAFATVQMRSHQFLLDTSGTSLKKIGPTKIDWSTDTRGYFPLDVLNPGDYVINIQDGNGNGAVLHYTSENIEIKDNDSVVVVLMPNKVLRGTVDVSEGVRPDIHLRIFGMERVTKANKDGFFTISDIPEGYHHLHFTSPLKGLDVLDTIVETDNDLDTTDIGSVIISSK